MSERRTYPSDLSDARWALIEPRLTAWRQIRTDARTEIGIKGRTPTHDLREIFDAILYLNRTGIPWRYLPHDFPPYRTVYGYFAAWSKDYAFDDATSLKYITAPNMVHFGRNALNDSGQLVSVNFLKVEYMGINSLNGLLVGLRLPALTTIDKERGSELRQSALGFAPRLRVAWDDAFTHNGWLESVYLPGVTQLRVRALANNPALARVMLGVRPPRQGADVFLNSNRATIVHRGTAAAWRGFVPTGNSALSVRNR